MIVDDGAMHLPWVCSLDVDLCVPQGRYRTKWWGALQGVIWCMHEATGSMPHLPVFVLSTSFRHGNCFHIEPQTVSSNKPRHTDATQIDTPDRTSL